jgi:tripartite ATP-independent transporter DctM subunit
MEWWVVALIFFAGVLFLLFSGLPVALCFVVINIIGAICILGGQRGLYQLILSASESVSSFSLVALPLFVFMGEILFHSGVGQIVIDAVDRNLGRLPGRLSLLTVVSATGLSTLSGSTIGTTALLGSLLLPEMRRRGYAKPMSLGPIIGCGSLAMLIPPSGLAVTLGALAHISIGKLLIGGVLPGLLLAVLFASYIIIRCHLNPTLAPSYDVTAISLGQRVAVIFKSILPAGFIFFLVVGLIILGIATPTEAAAAGCVGSLFLAAAYRKLTLDLIKKATAATLQLTAMILLIVATSKGYGQIMAFTGATRNLAQFAANLSVDPILVVVLMQFVLLILGMFMDQMPMMMITIPVYMPIVEVLKIDPVWFGVLMLISLDVGFTSPPFGMSLFVMKSVAPDDVSMGDIYRAAIPFVMLSVLGIILIMRFPAIATLLPSLMR